MHQALQKAGGSWVAACLQQAAEGPESVDPHWRIPARGLEAALAQYLAAPDTDQPFDLVSSQRCLAGSRGREGRGGAGDVGLLMALCMPAGCF